MTRSSFAVAILIPAGMLLLTSCNSSNGKGPTPGPGFAATALVSDGAVPAVHTDNNLKNPWGLAFGPGPAWIANNGTNTSTIYDGNGATLLPAVAMPAAASAAANPTGLVFNPTTDFVVTMNSASAPANFILSGEGGTIAAWAGAVNTMTAFTEYDGSASGTVYKGLALANDGQANFLYATDFHNAKIDVFNATFAKVTSPGGFVDPNLPAGYAPFGIANIGNLLYVSYAQQQGPDNHDEVDGAGLGLIDVFKPDGTFMFRFTSNGMLNAPWGMVMAPADFGSLSNTLLVGNFGDGTIHAFDPVTHNFLGALRTSSGTAFVSNGLWALAFGNGANNQPTNVLFYTAGTNGEADGTYGRIDHLAPSVMGSQCTGVGC